MDDAPVEEGGSVRTIPEVCGVSGLDPALGRDVVSWVDDKSVTHRHAHCYSLLISQSEIKEQDKKGRNYGRQA